MDLMKTFSFVGGLLPAPFKDMIPDFYCGDMADKMPFSAVATAIDTAVSRSASKAFFYPDAAAFDPFFTGLSPAHPWEFVDFDATSDKIETHHFCVDNFKINGIIELVQSLATQMGIAIPAGPLAILKKVNDIANMVNVLKITLRYEFVMVTSDQNIVAASNSETIAKTAVAKISGYSFGDLFKIDRSKCLVP